MAPHRKSHWSLSCCWLHLVFGEQKQGRKASEVQWARQEPAPEVRAPIDWHSPVPRAWRSAALPQCHRVSQQQDAGGFGTQLVLPRKPLYLYKVDNFEKCPLTAHWLYRPVWRGKKKTLLIFLLPQAPITHPSTPTGILCRPSIAFTGLLCQILPYSLPLPAGRRHVPTSGRPCPAWPHSRSTVGTHMIAMPLWRGLIYRDNLFSDYCKFTQGS